MVDAPAFEPTTVESSKALESVESIPTTVGIEIEWTSILWGIYLLGAIVMAVRLIKNLYALRVKSLDELETYKGYQLVLRDSASVPHSFYNRIYASLNKYKAGKIPSLVLDHEKAHLDQKHSLDILFIEFLIVVMWFNPLLYLVKYSIKLNHEFLADHAVINNGVPTASYQETLLSFTAAKHHSIVANTFNFPIIKKRFTIMKIQTTLKSGLLRSLAIIPVLALLVISCGKEVTQVEPTINHSTTNNDPDTTFGVNIDGYEPKGTVEYNGQFFKYSIQPDFSVELMTMDGQMIDLKKNRMSVNAYYDAEREVNELLENEANLKNKLSSGKFEILDASTTYTERDTVDNSVHLKGKSTELNIEDLKSTDFSKRTMVKFTEDGILKFMILPDYSKRQIRIREQMYENLGKVIDTKNEGRLKQALKTSIEQTTQNKEDYNKRLAFLRLADKQMNPVTYKINSKKVDKSEVEELIKKVNDVPFDLVTINGTKIELTFYTGTGNKMSDALLSNMYKELFETIDPNKNLKELTLQSMDSNSKVKKDTSYTVNDPVSKEKMKVTFTRTADPYSFYNLNGNRGSGTFTHDGVKYSYKMPNDLSIDLFHPNGKKVTDKEAAEMKIVLSPIWNSKTEEKIIKNDSVVKQYFENDNAVLFYPGGYTNDYSEMQAYDFGDTYIHKFLEHGKLRIDLMPYSWKKTNPSLIDFFKRDDI
jgi:hypothetical protein